MVMPAMPTVHRVVEKGFKRAIRADAKKGVHAFIGALFFRTERYKSFDRINLDVIVIYNNAADIIAYAPTFDGLGLFFDPAHEFHRIFAAAQHLKPRPQNVEVVV